MTQDHIKPSTTEKVAARTWRQRYLLDPDGPVPFSCRLDGKRLDLNDGHWQVKRIGWMLEAFHVEFGLWLRCRAKTYLYCIGER